MSLSFEKYKGFDWDQGNREKSWLKHRVSLREAEEVFFNKPLIVIEAGVSQSLPELRFVAFSKTDEGRVLTIIFTFRGELLRIISARPMHKKEREFYRNQSYESDT